MSSWSRSSSIEIPLKPSECKEELESKNQNISQHASPPRSWSEEVLLPTSRESGKKFQQKDNNSDQFDISINAPNAVVAVTLFVISIIAAIILLALHLQQKLKTPALWAIPGVLFIGGLSFVWESRWRTLYVDHAKKIITCKTIGVTYGVFPYYEKIEFKFDQVLAITRKHSRYYAVSDAYVPKESILISYRDATSQRLKENDSKTDAEKTFISSTSAQEYKQYQEDLFVPRERDAQGNLIDVVEELELEAAMPLESKRRALGWCQYLRDSCSLAEVPFISEN